MKYLSNFTRLFPASLERMLGTLGDCEILDQCWSSSGATKCKWGNFIRPCKEIQSNKMCNLHRKSRYMIFGSRQILFINKVQYFAEGYSEPCLTQPAFTSSKLTVETRQHGVKESSLLLTLNKFYTLF